jgi:leader peptidase (prepilin peptidase)/N-methyltransferase
MSHPPWRHAAVAAVAAATVAAGLIRFGWGARGAIEACLAGVLVILSAVDLDRRLLPNRIVLPAAGLILGAQIVFFPGRWAEWLGAAVASAAFLALPLLFVRGGLGMGDIKLGFLIGAGLGRATLPALLYGSLSAVPVALYLLITRGRAARRVAIAYGPFLSLGALIGMLTTNTL